MKRTAVFACQDDLKGNLRLFKRIYKNKHNQAVKQGMVRYAD